MLLAIDCGNTNIVFAIFDEAGCLRGEWRSSTNVNRTADEIGVWLTQVMTIGELDPRQINAAIIATVVPAVLFNLRVMCRRYFKCQALVVGSPDVDLGIQISVDRPEEVGADRLVNAVAARDEYGGPLVIVDFGTATTFDVVDQSGSYLGGAICPGVNLSLEVLHMAAAQLPRVAIGRPERVIGKNTIQAMRSGIFWGYVGLIEGMVMRISEELGMEVTAIATGGLSVLFTECTPILKHADPDLTLKGLLALHRRNVGKLAGG